MSHCRDFPGGPVRKTPCSQHRGPRFNPWSGNYIPHVATKSSNATTKRSCMLQQDRISSVLQLRPVIAIQFSSVTQSCPTLCDPMNRSTPGLPVHHQLPEFTQTQVHQVGDAIQPSHPLLSRSPPAPNPSQHQGLFQ